MTHKMKMTHYKNSFKNALMALLGGAMLCAACKKDEPKVEDEPKSAECDIVSFTVKGEAWNINGTNITHAYPAGTAATALTPTISLSPGATADPPASEAQNFFAAEGITYTVTAEDGVTKKTYTAKATKASYTACDIVSFSVDGEEWDIDGTDITYIYSLETLLTPAITLPPGATVEPPASEEQNFFTAEGVAYTVTAEDGITTKTYTAKATLQAIASGISRECTWAVTGAVGNYTLTVSGNGAMADYGSYPPWYQYRDDIKTAVIQDGVKTVGNYAFYGCSGLISVIIDNSVTTIGNSAFYKCSGLTSVTIPNSVTTIGDGVFASCSGLTSVDIPNSVTTIGGSAFANCSGLTSVTIPNSVTTIGNYAFAYCSGLTTVIIGNSVTTIGNYAFSGCSGLTSVTIPNSVTAISYAAFSGCSGLTSVTIPNSVTSIDGSAFASCSSLTSVTIPNSVTSIAGSAFASCSGLTSINTDLANMQYSSENGVLFDKTKATLVTYPGGKTGGYVIPNSVKTIGYEAFGDCTGLTSVTIPNSVTTIDGYAFSHCSGLTSVTIGNSVTTIGDWAFAYCSGLTSVTIPNSVTTIYSYAFRYCTGLTTVINLNPVPQDIDSVFYYVTISALTLKVPASAVEAYKAAPGWSEFGNIIANE